MSTAPGSGSAESGQRAAPPTELARGLSLGRYIVLERLGAGGMGVVYAAYDPELDRKVAIKLLRPRPELGAIGDRSASLLNEAKTLAALSHRNVVTVHDVGTFLGQVFIAMEFIGGGTLTQWLATGPSWREVLRCFIQAGEGLAAAHDKGLVHRDFKPDNVLLDVSRHPRVTDFGLAQKGAGPAPEPAATDSARVAGTVGFLAPEQVRRTTVDARSDQFAFCLSLHLGLYGEPAHPKSVDLRAPLPPVRAAPAGSPVPGWVRRVLLQGLSEDPASRFPSMRELLAALEADPSRARRDSLQRVGAAALILVVVGLGVGLSLRESLEQRTQRECLERVEAQLATMWSLQRRSAIEQSFNGISPELGGDTWVRVRDRLGPQFDGWGDSSRAACRLKGDAAPRALWTSCLEERRKTLHSMSELFAHPDAEVMTHALNTVLVEVAPASGCTPSAPAALLELEGSTPADEALRSGLARARVLRAAGKLTEGIGEARTVARYARVQKTAHVEAEAMLLVGEVSSELHRLDAEQNLLEAIVAAERVGNDEIRARAWISLVSWYSGRGRLEDAALANRQARAILVRLHDPALLLASQLTAEGILAASVEGPEAARVHFKKALEIRQDLLEAGHPLLMRSLNNLGNALPADQGLPLLSEVLKTRETLFGPSHPETAIAHENVGIALSLTHACGPALTHLETALDIRLKDQTANRALLGKLYGSIGTTLACMLRLPEAESSHRQAVTLLKEGGATAEEQSEQLSQLLAVMGQLKRPSSERLVFEDQLKRLEQ